MIWGTSRFTLTTGLTYMKEAYDVFKRMALVSIEQKKRWIRELGKELRKMGITQI